MSSLFDMISAFIAMLMSAAFLHFGAAGDSHPISTIAQVSPPAASSTAASDPADSVIDDTAAPPAKPVHHRVRRAAAPAHGQAASAGAGMMDTVRATSPLRRG